jgi:hypothetical protein
MTKCPNCGNKFSSAFCPGCGLKAKDGEKRANAGKKAAKPGTGAGADADRRRAAPKAKAVRKADPRLKKDELADGKRTVKPNAPAGAEEEHDEEQPRRKGIFETIFG